MFSMIGPSMVMYFDVLYNVHFSSCYPAPRYTSGYPENTGPRGSVAVRPMQSKLQSGYVGGPNSAASGVFLTPPKWLIAWP